jgi:hypothetical protein
VLEGFLHWNSTGRVELEHFGAEIQWNLVEILEVGFEVDSFEFRESRLEVW